MSHIFISYSTQDHTYAHKLADRLRREGFDVWLDNDSLRASDNWWEALVRALRNAGAFIVIMTPAARQSKWVQREITLADNWEIPAFPLLLDGDNFEIYVLTQFIDVRDAALPPPAFFDDLAVHARRESQPGSDVTTEESVRAAMDDEIMQAILDQLEAPVENPELLSDGEAGDSSASDSGSEVPRPAAFDGERAAAFDANDSPAADEAAPEMPDKDPAKKKGRVYADLNFVSQHALDTITQSIEQLQDKHVIPHVIPMDDDTALFQLQYKRGTRVTAEVSGRLRRWAGDMTHIYCDGRVFRKRSRPYRLLALAVPLVLFGLFGLTSITFGANSVVTETLGAMTVLLSCAIVPITVVWGTLSVISRLLIVDNRDQKRHLAKPEAKDRERLLHLLTAIIRDDPDASRLEETETAEDTPLTAAELQALVANARLPGQTRDVS